MKKIIFIITFVVMSNSCSKSWFEILNEKEELFQDNLSYKIIREQYTAFKNNEAPTIANPIIKNIPINENNDTLIDIWDMNNIRIKMLPNSPDKKTFSADFYNSGLPSASKIRSLIYKKLETLLKHLDELSPRFGYEKGSISIKVFEGLRDLKTQELLFKNKFNEIKALDTSKSDEEVELETSKWVSPYKNNIPVHSTGAAIDIRLWNENINDFVDLGKFGVIWGNNKEAQTFSENITDSQKLNRMFLLIAAAKSGLINYVYEWWHFSAGDRYAVYWQEKESNKRIAFHGPIN